MAQQANRRKRQPAGVCTVCCCVRPTCQAMQPAPDSSKAATYQVESSPTWVCRQVAFLQEQQHGCAFNACCPQHFLEVRPEGGSIKHPAGQPSTHAQQQPLSSTCPTWHPLSCNLSKSVSNRDTNKTSSPADVWDPQPEALSMCHQLQQAPAAAAAWPAQQHSSTWHRQAPVQSCNALQGLHSHMYQGHTHPVSGPNERPQERRQSAAQHTCLCLGSSTSTTPWPSLPPEAPTGAVRQQPPAQTP